MNQRGIHAGLAVIDLTEAPTPLAGNSDRLLPFFGHGAFVENKAAVRGAPQKKICVQGYLVHYWAMLPGGMRREMLQ